VIIPTLLFKLRPKQQTTMDLLKTQQIEVHNNILSMGMKSFSFGLIFIPLLLFYVTMGNKLYKFVKFENKTCL